MEFSAPPLSRSLNGQQVGRGYARMSGLTLIELMLVIAMIGVLLALALGGSNFWRERIKVTQAQTELMTVSAVIDAHWHDTQTYPASLAAIGYGDLRDPWGNPYAYVDLTSVNGNGQARKNRSLVPLNTDYDLYSKGADGQSVSPLTARASRDDVLRANNGGFYGLASNY